MSIKPQLFYLHVVHHEFVGQLAPVLGVHHLLVHEAVEDGEAAVGAERQSNVLVETTENGLQELIS